MRVTTDQFATAFDDIRKRALNDGCSVLILVAADCDALCAYHMLKDLLRAEYIKYKMMSVENQVDLENSKETIKESQGQIKVVVMLNCGGTVDVAQVLELPDEEQEEMCIYVLDSHRPLNLDNVYADNIHVFDDGETNIPAPEEVMESDDEDDEEDNDDDDSDNGEPGAKRAKWSDRVARRVAKQERLRTYYEASYYGVSSAVLVGHLVSELGRNSNSFLWLSALGLTDQFVHDKISSDVYVQQALTLQSEILRFNSAEESRRHRGVCLTPTEDARFFLLRQWNLYDAMRHSKYVVSRIPVWTNKGEERLKNLFATMGVSLQTSKQVYKTLDSSTKQHIFEQLQEVGHAYGLDAVTYVSFTYQRGYEPAVAASDVVYAINGILNHAAPGEGVQERVFKALDCLTMRKQGVFDFGVECAKEQEMAIMNQVQYAFQDDTGRKQRWHLAMVRTESKRFFTRPSMLTKLAQYLVHVRRYNTLKAHRMRQQVVAIQDDEEDTTTYVGVWCRPKHREGTIVPNLFSSLFPAVAEECKVDYALPEFDGTVVQLLKEHHGNFVLKLMREIIRITREQQHRAAAAAAAASPDA